MCSNSYYLKHKKMRTLKFDAQRILKSIQMIGSMWLIPQKWLYSDRFLQHFCLIVVDIFTRMSNQACFLKKNPLKCTYFEGKKGRKMYQKLAPSPVCMIFQKRPAAQTDVHTHFCSYQCS